jgi:hypothetical protein
MVIEAAGSLQNVSLVEGESDPYASSTRVQIYLRELRDALSA